MHQADVEQALTLQFFQADGFGTLAFSFPTDGIQNATGGNPDGVALVDPNGGVVQFLSYEGTFTATEGPANGMSSTDIGVAEDNGTTAVGKSLQLTGSGGTFTWSSSPEDETFGTINSGQDFAAFAAATGQSIVEDASLVFSSANGNAIGGGDVDVDSLGALPIYTPQGSILPLNAIANIRETVDSNSIRRINGQRTVTLNVIPPAKPHHPHGTAGAVWTVFVYNGHGFGFDFVQKKIFQPACVFFGRWIQPIDVFPFPLRDPVICSRAHQQGAIYLFCNAGHVDRIAALIGSHQHNGPGFFNQLGNGHFSGLGFSLIIGIY